MTNMDGLLTWVEISQSRLKSNIAFLKRQVTSGALFAPCIKGNAYGHGIVESARIFAEAGADWLCVVSLDEALKLRESGIHIPIFIMGYVSRSRLTEVIENDFRVICYDKEAVKVLNEHASKLQKTAYIHVKAETGNNRQGLRENDLLDYCLYVKNLPHVAIEGMFTHFANIEDTTDHSFAFSQVERLNAIHETLAKNGVHIPILHCANSAATILFPQVHMNMVRPGIATYGMWPSTETYVSYIQEHQSSKNALQQALTWKIRIAQIKEVPCGEFIGYGCSYKTTHDSTIAILPIGYYDGYDRKLSNQAYVLINGKRAPVRGRVCMNMIMVDVTHIPGAKVEDEVVLLGQSGEESISAELFASWAGTINYEVTTRIRESIARIVV